MIFFVFSYNRGPLLKNCVASIEHCAPGSPIILYDDRSNDAETQDILAEISKKHEVRSCGGNAGARHGALYANMQRAFESVTGDQLVCFIQDDAQLVRRVSPEDEEFIRRYFADNPRAGFLASVFQRRITKQSTLDRFEYDPSYHVRFCRHQSRKEVAGRYYSDICITSTGRLRDVGWRFLDSEYANELQAKSHFMEMGYMHAPFIMQLPNAPAYRNKQKTLAFRLGERLNKSGLYPFEYMSEADVQRLKERPEQQVPIAEDFLKIAAPGLRAPWIYSPLKRSRILRRLNDLEVLLRSRAS